MTTSLLVMYLGIFFASFVLLWWLFYQGIMSLHRIIEKSQKRRASGRHTLEITVVRSLPQFYATHPNGVSMEELNNIRHQTGVTYADTAFFDEYIEWRFEEWQRQLPVEPKVVLPREKVNWSKFGF